MKADKSILEAPAVQKLKARLNTLLDEYLLHDGWGHLEMDMRILTRHQKEVVIRAGREYRFVVDFQNHPAAGNAAGISNAVPLGKGSEA
ncbi:MAG: hypothetical protein ACI4RD_01220 [Kiritimatiellia bacterium]